MARSFSLRRRLGVFTRAAVFVAAMVLPATPALAAARHARLSADLADNLAAGTQQIKVIAHSEVPDTSTIKVTALIGSK